MKREGLDEYFPDELKNDTEILLWTVKVNGSVFDYLEDNLQKFEKGNDREIVLEAVRIIAGVLELYSEEIVIGRQIDIETNKSDGVSLKFACEELKKSWRVE